MSKKIVCQKNLSPKTLCPKKLGFKNLSQKKNCVQIFWDQKIFGTKDFMSRR